MPESEGSSGPPAPLLWVKEGKVTYTQALELVTKSVGSLFLKSQSTGPSPIMAVSCCLDPALHSSPRAESSTGQTYFPLRHCPQDRVTCRKTLPSLTLSSHPPKKACKCALSPFFTLAFWILTFYFAIACGPFLSPYIKLTSLIYTTCLDLRAFVRVLGFSAPRTKSPEAGSMDLSLCLLSPGLALTKLIQDETTLGVVIYEDRVLGVDPSIWPVLLGHSSPLGQLP